MEKLLIPIVALCTLCAPVAQGDDKKVILPKGATPNAAWSYGIEIDDTVYVSGMSGEDAAGNVPASFEAEMNQAFKNVEAVLKEAGMKPKNIVSVQVLLTDATLFDHMNTVYKAYFQDVPKPARTTIVVSKLVGPGHVEITVVAKK